MILKDLFGEDIDVFLNEMAPIFLEDSHSLMEQLNSAIPLGDFKTVKEAAHALKGSSASLGMEVLAQLCTELEGCDAGKVPVDLDKVFLEMRIEHDRICKFLSSQCQYAPA
ncbi:MAG: Hpt domain-containing protein [Chloroflexota bacterium]